MPVFPPDIVVRNASTFQSLANAFNQACLQAGGFLHQTASYLEPKIVNTMQGYGLDGTNRFGLGSDAKKASKSVTGPLRKAAEHMIDAGKLVGFAYLAYQQNVKGPIDAAKDAMKRSTDTLDE